MQKLGRFLKNWEICYMIGTQGRGAEDHARAEADQGRQSEDQVQGFRR